MPTATPCNPPRVPQTITRSYMKAFYTNVALGRYKNMKTWAETEMARINKAVREGKIVEDHIEPPPIIGPLTAAEKMRSVAQRTQQLRSLNFSDPEIEIVLKADLLTNEKYRDD